MSSILLVLIWVLAYLLAEWSARLAKRRSVRPLAAVAFAIVVPVGMLALVCACATATHGTWRVHWSQGWELFLGLPWFRDCVVLTFGAWTYLRWSFRREKRAPSEWTWDDPMIGPTAVVWALLIVPAYACVSMYFAGADAIPWPDEVREERWIFGVVAYGVGHLFAMAIALPALIELARADPGLFGIAELPVASVHPRDAAIAKRIEELNVAIENDPKAARADALRAQRADLLKELGRTHWRDLC